VTVRVTTLKGASAGAYYVEALPDYYLAAGEPRGLWHGHGAQVLGLAGEVGDGAFLAVMAGMVPSRPAWHLGGRYEERSVRGFDLTCSAPKSVSVLFALGDEHTRVQVLAAHDRAVAAMVGWIEDHAHTRYRIAGQVAVVDAGGIVAATFRQHTSRALDPQVHTHVVIANRVLSPDGRWLALDARLIKHDQRSLSALYHSGLRAELTRRLGVRWHTPEHGIAEIRDIPDDVRDLYSSRTRAMRDRLEVKLDRFHDSFGREPTPRERWQLEREAVLDSRPAKTASLDAVSLHGEWADQARTIGHDPAQLVTNTIRRTRGTGIDRGTAAAITDQALAVMSERQSSWRPTELHREIAAAIPTTTAATAEGIVEWIDQASARVVSGCVDLSRPVPAGSMLRRDGRPVSESVLDRALTTRAILDQEAGLLGWAEHRLAHDGNDHPSAAGRSRFPLHAGQAQAAGAVAGIDDLVLVVGPAGTGKTTALTPAVAQLRADGRAVFGVAPSATAAEVLELETGVRADTLDKLLVEHRRPYPSPRFDLPVGATVIVDEAGMIPTARLAELADLADLRGWRIALVGDPLQFSAVDRGGMFGLLVDTYGAVELDRVHRFTHPWERDVSLQLRHGHSDIVDVYDLHDRLHGGTTTHMERAAVTRWWTARQNGHTSLLMAPTLDAVERLNLHAQRTRLGAGHLDPHGPTLTAGPYTLHVGDEIATRHNDRQLVTDRGEMVRNRATWTIDQIYPDGTVTAIGRHGTVHLPAPYVAEHVELAYAVSAMGAQGRTVDTAILYADKATDVRNLYVAMTRGRDSNDAFLAVTGEQTARDVFAQSVATDWIDQPAHQRHHELHATTPHHPGLLDGPHLREFLEQRHQITETIRVARMRLAAAPRERQNAEKELARADRQRHDAEQAIANAEAVLERYDRPLHRRRHTTEIADARHTLTRTPHTIDEAVAAASRATDTLAAVDRSERDARDVLEQRPMLERELAYIERRLDTDVRTRTRIVRLEQPDTVTDILGHRPTAGRTAQEWDRAAALIHQHQDAFDLDHGLGPQPDYFERSAYRDNREAIHPYITEIARPTMHRAVGIESPGIEIEL
jgi:conjugative relaxase-like TrwC/TraI family protein